MNKKHLNLRISLVSKPGQVAALNAGLKAAKGDIIAFTDDDTISHKDWLNRIENHFLSDEQIGGVGGRDFLYENGKLAEGKKETVGKLQWFGRLIGYHHLGYGMPREVDMLKGANMSFTREAISGLKFDTRLRGGAEVRNDTAFCLAVKKRRWKLIYDPKVIVDHYPAVRYEANKRGNYDWKAVEDGAHNETLVLLDYLPFIRKFAYFIYMVFIGNIFTPGIVEFLRILPKEKGNAFLRLMAAYKGRYEGWKTYRNSK
jgi:glycosyltransferase involved in cell wall biosynthesis